MKKFKLFKVLSIFAIAAAGAVAVGVGTKAPKVESAEAATNTVYVDVRRIISDNKRWDADNAKFAICYQDNGSNEYWTGFATSTDTAHVYQISTPTSLSFSPTKAFITRQDSGASSPSWNKKWNQANIDPTLRTFVTQVYGWDNGAWDTSDVYVKGGKVGDWSTDSFDVKLPNIKFTNTQDIEIYGEVTIPAGTDFKTFAENTSYGGYETHSSVSSYFSGDGSSNIACSKTGTYEVFFKYDQKVLYITNPAKAAADQWSQTFMTGDCTTATTGTKAKWGTHASSFAALVTKYGSTFTEMFTTEPHVDHKDTATGYIALAVQRYDYVLELYGVNDANTDELGYQDFMGRVAANKVTPNLYSGLTLSLFGNNDNNGLIVSIVVISIVSVSTLAGLLFIRKRKHI